MVGIGVFLKHFDFQFAKFIPLSSRVDDNHSPVTTNSVFFGAKTIIDLMATQVAGGMPHMTDLRHAFLNDPQRLLLLCKTVVRPTSW